MSLYPFLEPLNLEVWKMTCLSFFSFRLCFFQIFVGDSMLTGQIIVTSPPNGGLVREMGPLISEKPRLVKYYSFGHLDVP